VGFGIEDAQSGERILGYQSVVALAAIVPEPFGSKPNVPGEEVIAPRMMGQIHDSQ
jgi:hypothetical protein